MTADAPADLALAVGIGLLLGLERERRKSDGPSRPAAGIRTFALVALIGGLCDALGGEALIAVGAGFVGLLALAGYARSGRDDPGTTSEAALLVAFLLGALAQRDAALAAGSAVAVTIVLAARTRLHTLAREALSEQELHDGLLLAAAALIVLPLIPDHGVGPNDALNPFVVWRLVVLVMAISAAGYIAQRLVGPKYGLPLAGLIGGFVSSTATIGSMGARSAQQPSMRHGAVAAGVASTVATVVLLAAVVGAIDSRTLWDLAVPFAFAGSTAIAYAAVFGARAVRAGHDAEADRGRAFDLRVAAILALAISGLLLAAALLHEGLGDGGVWLATAVAGLGDAQSAGATAAGLARTDTLMPSAASVAVLVGLTTNTVSKAVVALAAGGWAYAVQIWPGLVAVAGSAWLGLMVQRAV